MGSEPNRFLQPQQAPAPRRKRWEGCWGGLSCFRKQKGGKRIVPSRMPEGNAASNHPNGPPAGGLPSQTTGIAPAFYAPPSSPVSFSNSALPSTAQSPSCFQSASSPGGPSSTMFATGPYAHEPQLVSPPVFSAFTTEPSTAPVTPPPELAHLTTPSSPDVPYARFLLSSTNVKGTDKASYIMANDLQAYSLYPESPASAFRSPVSRTPGGCLSPSVTEKEITSPSVTPDTKPESGGSVGLNTVGASKLQQDSNFFCPETFAQFYQEPSSFPHGGGRLSISKESEAYSNSGNGHQNRQSKICKPDPEELEAYRASFGFSADEIITTTHYVEISDLSEGSFSMTPPASNKSVEEDHLLTAPLKLGMETGKRKEDFPNRWLDKAGLTQAEDGTQQKGFGNVSGQSVESDHVLSDGGNDIFSNMGASRIAHNYQFRTSNSDAEIEYRRGRSRRGD